MHACICMCVGGGGGGWGGGDVGVLMYSADYTL